MYLIWKITFDKLIDGFRKGEPFIEKWIQSWKGCGNELLFIAFKAQCQTKLNYGNQTEWLETKALINLNNECSTQRHVKYTNLFISSNSQNNAEAFLFHTMINEKFKKLLQMGKCLERKQRNPNMFLSCYWVMK